MSLSTTTTTLLYTTAAFISTTSATISWNWAISGVPKEGIDHIVFPVSISDWPNRKEWYIANQFPVSGCSIGYTGIQPISAANGLGGKKTGKAQLIFSSFDKNAKPEHKNCKYGADGGPGVSCAVLFENLHSGMNYDLHVEVREEKDRYIYTGYLMDPDFFLGITGGYRNDIGAWSVPASKCGLIKTSQAGFLEEFKFKCADSKHIKFTVKAPRDGSNRGKGTIRGAHSTDKCKAFNIRCSENGADSSECEAGNQKI